MGDHSEELAIKAVFLAAIALDPPDRAAFVHGACPQEGIRRRVEKLLANHREPAAEERAPLASVREFQIVRELGRGGMGVVYLAEDRVLGRTIALKTLADWVSADALAVARFFHEAKAAAQLSSPHIVQVYQFGEDQGRHFIAMEYVEGGSLAAGADAQGVQERSVPSEAASFRQIASLVADAAAGLQAAHAHDPPVIHRDVKPSNILTDRQGRAKLADFGIAKVLSGSAVTVGGHVPCTPQYMSPEQAMGAGVDHRSDIFSLGVVLYELLSGRRPFPGETAPEVTESLRAGEPPSLVEINRCVPVDLATICHKSIETKPEDRYQSAMHMEAELRCFVSGAPILTRSPGLRRRAIRWVRRHRRLVLVACAALSPVLLTILVVLARSNWRASRVLVRLGPTVAEGIATVSRLDDQTLEYEAAEALGRTPLSRYLPAGSYRITVTADGARAAEVDVRLDPRTTREVGLAPRLLTDEEATQGMVRVPGGVHVFGRAGGAPFEAARSVRIPEFYIDACEVSNADYKQYVDATGAATPELWKAMGGYDETLADRPIVGLTLVEMGAFAAWAGKRLPTALEWEAAARYPDGRRYPWAGAPPAGLPEPTRDDLIADRTADDAEWLRIYRERTVPVRSAPEVRSALGLFHTFGNVSEATSTFVPSYGANIVKGGTVLDTPRTWALNRNAISLPPAGRSLTVGFRCARSARSASSEETDR